MNGIEIHPFNPFVPDNAVFFTSKFVEQHFRKLFPEITNTVCLPSPSPRYASMNKAEKITHYKNKLLKNER